MFAMLHPILLRRVASIQASIVTGRLLRMERE
jgi:hypothetical protein